MLAFNNKANTDYIVSSCRGLSFYLFLEKVFTLVLSFFLIERWTQPLSYQLNISNSFTMGQPH